MRANDAGGRVPRRDSPSCGDPSEPRDTSGGEDAGEIRAARVTREADSAYDVAAGDVTTSGDETSGAFGRANRAAETRDSGGASGAAARPGRTLVAGDVADVLVRRLFSVGLDLHAALTYLEARVSEDTARQKIHGAIGGLDESIKDVRAMVFGLRAERTAGSIGVRAMIIEAVERACGPRLANCPAIVLGRGLDSVIDEAGARRVARIVHRILGLVPDDRLPGTRVEVTADLGPPGRLIAYIEAPAHGLADAAARLGTMTGRHIEVSYEAVAGSPAGAVAGSRVRVECGTA
jgi:hypothetical protein